MSIEDNLEAIVRRVVREELAAAKPQALVTIAAYAAAHSISTSTVRAAIREGRLSATRIGRAIRINAEAAIGTTVQPAAPVVSHAVRETRVLALVRGGK